MSKEEENRFVTASAAIPVAAPAAVPTSEQFIQQQKLGAKCCGCCCDYRRAVIILGIIGIVQSSINLIMALATTAISAVGATDLDDDVAVTVLDGVAGVSTFVSIAFFVSALGYTWQVYAALRYNIRMLSCVLLVSLFNFAISVYGAQGNQAFITLYVLYCGVYIYPIVGLIVEIKKGIMSKATYPREAYSCCCQPQPQSQPQFARVSVIEMGSHSSTTIV